MWKKALCLIFAFLLSINSFAVAVSDNDGSAFITKAEFDSLKNDFQNQINTYNTNIDSKIDGAIAAYIAGVSIDDDPIDYWKDVESATNGNFYFISGFDQRYLDAVSSGISSFKPGLNIMVNRRLYVNEWTNPKWVYTVLSRRSGTSVQGWHSISLTTVANSTRGQAWMDGTTGSRSYQIDHKELFYTAEERWHKASELSWETGSGFGGNLWSDATYGVTHAKNTYRATYEKSEQGNGASFLYHSYGNGRKMLRTCNYALYPLTRFNGSAHTYKNFNGGNAISQQSIYEGSTGQDDNTSLTLGFNQITDIGVTYSVGSELSPTSTSNGTWGDAKTVVIQRKTNEDFSILQVGVPGTINIVALNDLFPITNSDQKTISADSTKTTRQVLYYPSGGPSTIDAKMSGIKFTYYIPSLNYESRPISSFNQETLSNLMNADIRMQNGVRIGKVNKEGSKVRVKFKFVARNGGDIPVSFAISNKCFIEGYFQTGAKDMLSDTSAVNYYNTTTNQNLDLVLTNVEEDDEIWLNCYVSSGTDLDAIKISDFSIQNYKG